MNTYHIEYSGKNTELTGTVLKRGESKKQVKDWWEEHYSNLNIERIIKAN